MNLCRTPPPSLKFVSGPPGVLLENSHNTIPFLSFAQELKLKFAIWSFPESNSFAKNKFSFLSLSCANFKTKKQKSQVMYIEMNNK